MSYGRNAPEGIPQEVWDKAIEEWLEDGTTTDSRRIMSIAKRIMDPSGTYPFKRWWPDAVEHIPNQIPNINERGRE